MDHPLLRKMYLRPGHRAVVLNAPASYEPVLAAAPASVALADRLDGTFDFIHYFATQRAELERDALRLKAALKPKGLLWVSYPKGKGIPTDLKRDIVVAALRPFGLQGVAQVAIDEVWSAVRFKPV